MRTFWPCSKSSVQTEQFSISCSVFVGRLSVSSLPEVDSGRSRVFLPLLYSSRCLTFSKVVTAFNPPRIGILVFGGVDFASPGVFAFGLGLFR